MKTFILHWLDEHDEIIEGYSIPDAFMKAGYGKALRALDYYEEKK